MNHSAVPTTVRKKIVRQTYPQCLDVERTRCIVENIRQRFTESHLAKAYHILQFADKVEAQQQKKKKNKSLHSSLAYSIPSDMFGEAQAVHVRHTPWRPKAAHGSKLTPQDMSIKARMLGLAKADEFTGTEAEALKKLLKTLRTKTWDPELYFHIRFFSIRHTIHPMSQEAKILARQRWHFLLRMLSIMAKIEYVLAERSYKKTLSCQTYIDMVESASIPILWGPDHDLQFEKDDFKVNVFPPMLSIEAQSILRDKLSDQRKPQEVAQAVRSLQYVTDFAKLPVNLQYCFVEEAHYLCVGSKRVILRQGHVPQNVYFVLQGQAMSKRLLPNNKTETTGILRRGDAFGSSAPLGNSCRLVTVVSQTPLHLLVVPKQIFIDTFYEQLSNPELCAILFLSKMWFMQFWPVELLRCSSQCCIRQFRRSEIIEASAESTSWIYVIKTGTCKLYQRFDVKPLQRLSVQLQDGSPNQSGEMCGRSRLSSAIPRSRRESEASVKMSSDKDLDVSGCSQSTITKKYQHKLICTLRHLDVFGLEDIEKDSRGKPRKHLLLISGGVQCAMLNRNLYFKMAGPRVKARLAQHTADKKLTYKQITKEDCLLIGLVQVASPHSLHFLVYLAVVSVHVNVRCFGGYDGVVLQELTAF